MTVDANSRRVAILWFVAAALALFAAVLGWRKDGDVEWALFAAAAFMTVLGVTRLRLPKTTGAATRSERKRP